MYDDEVRKWINGVGIEKIGKRLVNSKEGPPTFEQPKMSLEKLLEYGQMLVQEDAALGDANRDPMARGTFYDEDP